MGCKLNLEPTTKERALELKTTLSKKLGYKITISQWKGSMKGHYHLRKWHSMYLPDEVEPIQTAIRDLGGIPIYTDDYSIDFYFKKGEPKS